MAEKEFYLGRIFDMATGKVTGQDLLYDPADLTTHAIVTGMTGSGKTGLCVGLLEEAALQGVPALIIDPKGDLTNLLLHFPDLAPEDFQPWIDPVIADRAGKGVEQAATEASLAWRNGLAEWNINPERITALKNAVQFGVFTPGSDAGLQVNVLSSLDAPAGGQEPDSEALRDRISSTVTALLGLVGFNDIEPLESREHILLSNLFQAAWSQGQNLELKELILQVQSPPFADLGAFPVDTLFPAKDRMALAIRLNNILAAPSFQAWREGMPLDVQSLLFTEDGRPRHSVFYLAHLSDAERMFFITLLFASVESWMRTQAGSTALRALLYMDEIYGYLPPISNPPSKQPLLRMLKQARAFGLGILLATQNPVDLDYKGLSNAGTWFIGKLQTERDKMRLLEGLESAAGGVPRSAYDKLISSLGKRVFIMHNVHEREPKIFQTRWAMNFLVGPLTRTQIPALNQMAGAAASAVAPLPRPSAPAPAGSADPVSFAEAAAEPAVVRPATSPVGSVTKPPVPPTVAEYFLVQNYSLHEAFKAAGKTMPADSSIESVLYRPVLLASAQVRFLDRKYGVDAEVVRSALVNTPQKRGTLRWEEFPYNGPTLDQVETSPSGNARYIGLEAPLNDAKLMTALQKDFVDWVYRTSSVKARGNEALKIYAGPDVSEGDFIKACAETAREARDADLAKKTAALDRQIKTLQAKLGREQRELEQDQADLRNRNIESAANALELGASLFGLGRKKSVSTQLTKHRMSQNAKADVEESKDTIEQYEKDLADLTAQREQIAEEVQAAWADVVNKRTEITITPKKTDVHVSLFGVAWMPYYIVNAGGGSIEVAAYGQQ